ncbi:PREDICTED: uncharacterized protein LOC108778099 isoform X1 [Cyphomyrmex costatus]|uniref:uncharacterized protein LOC108778099 isoform X1 n=1 Tax=Cyphomyrmex costatus TaxID=456900 RepID=UPI000852354A|nr:PREDICTED: uncharacterized protein LOC108778099 isoform X1 [Cyphomyrmex costatus]XP_018400696.1 PREDICTED: uncharacterized protein LOC108778099 isoform X1 [Cyphomyrmex costatus]
MASIAFTFRIGRSTVSTIIADTCEYLWQALKNEMFIPSEDNWKEITKEFYTHWNFPHYRCCRREARCCEGSHSINLMAVASALYRFLLVDIGAEGRHSGVFKNSLMGQLFADYKLYLPLPSLIVENGDPMPYVLVADEAFQLTNYTMRPYPGKILTYDRRIFNYRLSRARRVVENTFGIKARFC